MSNMTANMQRFVQGMAQGLPQKQAALLAGYAASSAKVTASQLMKRPDIKAAIRKAKAQAKAAAPTTVPVDAIHPDDHDDDSPILKAHYDTPGGLMMDAMNSPRVAFGMRVEIAKQLLPYYHAKIGEKGKKQTANERAGEIANGEKQSDTGRKYQTRSAPTHLHAVK